MKLIKKAAALLMAAMAVLSLSACGSTQSDDANNQQGGEEEKEQIIFGTSADYAPFEFHTMVNGTDTIVGSDIDLAKQIAEDLGKELVIKDISFDVLLNELQNGTIDFVVAAMASTDERKEQADPSDSYYGKDYQRVVFKKENAEKFKSFDDFAGAKVAVQSGAIQVDLATDNLTGCELLILQSVPDMFNNLLNDKCDAVLVDGNVAEGYVASNSDLAILDQDFPSMDGSCVWVQKGDPQGLLETINKTIASCTESGKYEEWLAAAEKLDGGK